MVPPTTNRDNKNKNQNKTKQAKTSGHLLISPNLTSKQPSSPFIPDRIVLEPLGYYILTAAFWQHKSLLTWTIPTPSHL